MLVLMRKLGEEIQIGSTITVKVLTVSRSRVKLGISGPREVLVTRPDRNKTAAGAPMHDAAPRWHEGEELEPTHCEEHAIPR